MKLAFKLFRSVNKEMLSHIIWGTVQAFRVAPVFMVCLILLSFLEGIGPAFIVFVSKNLIDETVIGAGGGTEALMRIVPWVGAYFIASMLSMDIMFRIRTPLTERLRQRLNYSIDTQRFALATHLPLLVFEDKETYDKLQRSDNPGNKIDNLIHNMLWGFQNAVQMISLAIYFAVLSPWVPVLLISLQIPMLFLKGKAQKLWLDLTYSQTEDQRKAAYIDELLTGRNQQKELRIFGLKAPLSDRWRLQRVGLLSEALALRKKVILLDYPGNLINLLSSTAILIYAATQLSHQALTAGLFVALFQGVGRFEGAANGFAFGFREMLQGAGEVGFIRDYLELERKSSQDHREGQGADSNQRKESFPAPLTDGVSFENVTFRYPGREPLLHDVTFRLKAGEHVALVGENGAGKSTISKLLLGLYIPDSGAIRADGRAYSEIDPESLRDNVTAAFQDFCNMEFSLAQSIAVGNPRSFGPDGWTPNISSVQHAASLGGADEVAGSLAGGWSQPVGYTLEGGVGLSGGQWQRIALSRALMREPQVLILDEPTAALDPKAEAGLYTRFMEIMRGRTVVVISHRLGSARMADRILVLKNGEIIEEGHHDDLVKAKGEYARMWEEQAQWYQ